MVIEAGLSHMSVLSAPSSVLWAGWLTSLLAPSLGHLGLCSLCLSWNSSQAFPCNLLSFP